MHDGETAHTTANDVFPIALGCVRSGTTMLRAILDSHPDLAVPPEAYFVVPALQHAPRYEQPGGLDVAGLLAEVERSGSFTDWSLEPDALRSLRDAPPETVADAVRGLYASYARARRKARYADKTPFHLFHVQLLARTFPETRFVHIVRDGRDVVPSLLEMSFGPDRFPEAALFWARRVSCGRRAGLALGPGRYLEIRYEDLVADPETVMRAVCSFLDLAWAPEMLAYHTHAEELLGGLRFTDHVQGIRRPPTRNARDWRTALTAHQLQLFDALAGDLLAELGYERAGAPVPGRVRVEAAAWRTATTLERRTRPLRSRTARRLHGVLDGRRPAEA